MPHPFLNEISRYSACLENREEPMSECVPRSDCSTQANHPKIEHYECYIGSLPPPVAISGRLLWILLMILSGTVGAAFSVTYAGGSALSELDCQEMCLLPATLQVVKSDFDTLTSIL